MQAAVSVGNAGKGRDWVGGLGGEKWLELEGRGREREEGKVE